MSEKCTLNRTYVWEATVEAYFTLKGKPGNLVLQNRRNTHDNIWEIHLTKEWSLESNGRGLSTQRAITPPLPSTLTSHASSKCHHSHRFQSLISTLTSHASSKCHHSQHFQSLISILSSLHPSWTSLQKRLDKKDRERSNASISNLSTNTTSLKIVVYLYFRFTWYFYLKENFTF